MLLKVLSPLAGQRHINAFKGAGRINPSSFFFLALKSGNVDVKGFTLIEIVIVVVIIGILASLALPRLTAQLEIGRAGEAVSYFGVLKSAAVNCYDSTQDMSNCNTTGLLGITPPASPRYTYTLANTGSNQFTVMAVSTASANNCLKMSVSGGTGQIGMTGYGDLISVVQRASPNAANGASTSCGAY